MEFQIKHKSTGAILFRADLSAEYETKSRWLQLGAAVKLAVKAGANLADANLADAYLADAYLADANLADAYLTRANLTRANLAGANLARANLARANLAGANLTRADLAGANLARANLAGANYMDLGFNERGNRFGVENDSGKVRFIGGCRRWDSIEGARAHYAPDAPTVSDKACALARLDAGHAMAIARGWIQPIKNGDGVSRI